MSEDELLQALQRMPVITLNGYVRLLSAKYRDRLVTELVDYLDDDEEPGIILESVDAVCLEEALKKNFPSRKIPSQAIDWLIKAHCDVVLDENGTQRYRINEKAVCRSKISQLLRMATCFAYSTFERTVQQILPIGVEFREEYLEGLAFVDNALATGKTIRYLSIDDLPEEPIKR
ncbi:unnamed protein product [Gongylonema pulchrum]|uniref:Sister chromatid cohesion protein DCC1 n=1 Tax=Gongylonema pulchrum TaxID=637853 RepID=A0A183DND0_9BILA|nr:unnamed protein product [Gongylonema pulchrum]